MTAERFHSARSAVTSAMLRAGIDHRYRNHFGKGGGVAGDSTAVVNSSALATGAADSTAPGSLDDAAGAADSAPTGSLDGAAGAADSIAAGSLDDAAGGADSAPAAG